MQAAAHRCKSHEGNLSLEKALLLQSHVPNLTAEYPFLG